VIDESFIAARSLPMKAHGFVRPYHPKQVASWIVFPIQLILYYIVSIIVFLRSGNAKLLVVSIVVNTVLTILLVSLVAILTYNDPTDPLTKDKKNKNNNSLALHYSFKC
jgi:Mn2+/Fe2+ NRAMP family transporter